MWFQSIQSRTVVVVGGDFDTGTPLYISERCNTAGRTPAVDQTANAVKCGRRLPIMIYSDTVLAVL